MSGEAEGGAAVEKEVKVEIKVKAKAKVKVEVNVKASAQAKVEVKVKVKPKKTKAADSESEETEEGKALGSTSIPAESVCHFDRVSNDLLAQMLTRVDSVTVVKTCRLVCRRWAAALDKAGFWLSRLGTMGPPPALLQAQDWDLPRLDVKRPFRRNLLLNPSGEEGMEEDGRGRETPRHWHCPRNGGDGWCLETPPVGSDQTPEVVEQFPVALATSYELCEKVQTVDLVAAGLHPDLIDSFRPPIEVSEWHCGRFDCGTKYRLKVELLGRREDASHGTSSSSDSDSVFTDEMVTADWNDNSWTESRHVFRDYAAGVRFVRFVSAGQDTKFWAGHYGAKTAQASVNVLYQ